jgi:uncharacterized protein YecT (DUF1311 family)
MPGAIYALAIVAVALIWSGSTGPARAEDTYQTIAACAAADHGPDKDEKVCIGLTSGPCLETPEGQSTAGMVDCIERETAEWDALLNQTYKKLLAAAPKKAAEKVRQSQRNWLAARNLDCSLDYDLIEGGTMALPMGADCTLRKTAYRVIELKGWLGLVQ